MSLKIKPIPEEPEPIKTTFKLKPETLRKLHAYLQAYEAAYGKKADSDYIVNEILEGFFASDKEFLAYLKENPLSPLPEPTGSKKRPQQPKPQPQPMPAAKEAGSEA
ncbi:DUF2274 domain-containing protein [Geobacter grbiciae]|uniref:DUF2274 domain-containing protein n=1 Tax=Geobacter grbiciae TaxID=155042 RepID=UPI001C024D61|nr:DUF2274 domain-containing protein [Geobacter grbiciae]MBT1077221.1 DUF2274 domain-containing protein [Geobacter grbiciae]